MYLLDTSVFSFIIRNDPLLQLYEEAIDNNGALFLSAMTICELYSGAEIKRWGARRLAELEEHISKCTVLPIDGGVAKKYGYVIAKSRSVGLELMPPDALIVATAKRYNLTLVAHDIDMLVSEQMGIKLICNVR